jgi:hypothetical protein
LHVLKKLKTSITIFLGIQEKAVEIIEKTHASWAKLRAQPNVAPSLWLGN